MSRDIVQLLPEHVANQIAAGEVVQRPASVVKELLENAIDAAATHITLAIKDAGKTLIQVSDNGVGMSPADALLSFERHATSKINTAADLFHLTTKGFRGEALASIAAISHVSMKTCRMEDELGFEVDLKGGQIIRKEPGVVSKGTTVGVKNLFYNVPARRNFLKSDRIELRHIIDEFERVAVAHPQIGFAFYHNDDELFGLEPSNRRQRIVGVFGRKINEKLVPITEDTDIVRIEGFVGKPEFAKRTKGEQFFFVNNRYVKSGYLHHAIKGAYEGLLQEKQHPTYFLFLQLDPETIDINIHPTKTEIKFEDEHAIYTILKSAVKHSLGQFNIAPTLDFRHDSKLDTPYNYKDKAPRAPQIEVDRNFNPFSDNVVSPSTGGVKRMPQFKREEQSWESLYVGLSKEESEGFSKVQFESEVNTENLFYAEAEDRQHAGVFQLQRKYIVSSLKESMLIVHQHRAHYRILFEEFLKNITVERGITQQLLFPLILPLNPRELQMLKGVKEMLEQIGFQFASFDQEQVQISGIPSSIIDTQVNAILDRFLADFEQNVPKEELDTSQALARILARNASIKTGISLNTEEQLSIINRLFACKEPNLSPESKPVFIRLGTEDLDKRFK